MKKGKIVKLEWCPGSYINSGMGYNKKAIRQAMRSANYVKNNGYGNYSVIEYSEYIASFIFEDGSTDSFDIKRQIKDAFNISRMTEKQRNKIENILPIDVEVDGHNVKFLICN